MPDLDFEAILQKEEEVLGILDEQFDEYRRYVVESLSKSQKVEDDGENLNIHSLKVTISYPYDSNSVHGEDQKAVKNIQSSVSLMR